MENTREELLAEYENLVKAYKVSYKDVLKELGFFPFYTREYRQCCDDLREAVERNDSEAWIDGLRKRIRYIRQRMGGIYNNLAFMKEDLEEFEFWKRALIKGGLEHLIDPEVKEIFINHNDCKLFLSIIASITTFDCFRSCSQLASGNQRY